MGFWGKRNTINVRPDVLTALKTMAESGKYMLMITYKDPRTDILQHKTFTENFPYNDMENSYAQHGKHVKEQLAKKG